MVIFHGKMLVHQRVVELGVVIFPNGEEVLRVFQLFLWVQRFVSKNEMLCHDPRFCCHGFNHEVLNYGNQWVGDIPFPPAQPGEIPRPFLIQVGMKPRRSRGSNLAMAVRWLSTSRIPALLRSMIWWPCKILFPWHEYLPLTLDT